MLREVGKHVVVDHCLRTCNPFSFSCVGDYSIFCTKSSTCNKTVGFYACLRLNVQSLRGGGVAY